jgi:hypothetical protein
MTRRTPARVGSIVLILTTNIGLRAISAVWVVTKMRPLAGLRFSFWA